MRHEEKYLNKKSIRPKEFYEIFKNAFKLYQKKEFDEISNNREGEKFAKTLVQYFLGNDQFLKSPLLNIKSSPSLEKGLLIVGNFGSGKTSVFKTFHQLFFESNSRIIDIKLKDCSFLHQYKFGYAYHSSNQIVKDFEGYSSPEERKFFWEKICKGTRYFDDLTTEKEASNFGKFNLFEDILEMRYDQNSITFASMNYSGESIESTLEFLAQKYGERVYDRLFEMFNFIELKGKSFRK